MADAKWSDDTAFPPDASPALTDYAMLLQDPSGTPADGKSTLDDILALFAAVLVLDEDDMSSDDATKVPTQQSTKAYVDAHISDTTAAHAGSAISIADSGGYFTGGTVEEALQEIGADLADTETLAELDPASDPDTDDTLVGLEDGSPVLFSPANVRTIINVEDGATADGIVAAVDGVTVNATTSPTTIFDGTISKPAAAAGDLYVFRTAGTMINLSGGTETITLTAQYNSANLWTPFAVSLDNGQACSFFVEVEIQVVTVGAPGSERVKVRFEQTDPASPQEPFADSARLVASSPTPNNNTTVPFTLTTTHSDASASLNTIGLGATLQRIPSLV